MIYIDLENNPPPVAWITEADKITAELLAAANPAERKVIIERYEKLWGQLKKHLANLSNGKCWYSEAKEDYSYYHVDHFRPKLKALDVNGDDQGGYWWLAFNWRNYRLCGSVGNTCKRDYFAVRSNKAIGPASALEEEENYMLDPAEIDDPLKLTYTPDGLATPITVDPSHWDFIRADYTIKRLNLNFESLKEARKDLWKKCFILIEELIKLLDQEKVIQSKARQQKIREKMKILWSHSRSSSPYSATVKTCLQSTGLEWAIKLAA